MKNMKNTFYKETLTYQIIKSINAQVKDKVSLFLYVLGIFTTSVRSVLSREVNMKNILSASVRFGIDSLPLSIIIVSMSGMIIALQVTGEMVKQGATDYIGTLIALVEIREIAPIMGSFAIISMVGSSIAAEIATMKITDQVDAMYLSKVNPIAYLIAPRLLAGVFIMPSVIIISTAVALLAAFLPVHFATDMSFSNYKESLKIGMFVKDIWIEVLKSSVFGGTIALICSSLGFRATGGAIDVGIATTKAVVYSFIIVVIFDFIISYMFFY